MKRVGSTLPRTTFQIATVLILCHGAARALECHVDTTRTREVRFVSDAPIEDFEGKTDRLDGYVYWPQDALAADHDYEQSELYFEVLLGALDTGIDLRNRHMRDNYLHTSEYPYASFRGALLTVVPDADSAWIVTCRGSFGLHGVEQTRELTCRVAPREHGFHVRCDFDVALTDHDIEIPSLMFMKIDEIIAVKLDFHLKVVAQAD